MLSYWWGPESPFPLQKFSRFAVPISQHPSGNSHHRYCSLIFTTFHPR